MTKSFFARKLTAALMLALATPLAATAGDCVEAGSVVLFVPQQEGWFIGSIGGTYTGASCTYDLSVKKDWTIRLKPEGSVKLSIGTTGYARVDPLQPFKAKADGTIRIVVTRDTKRSDGVMGGTDLISKFTYKLVMDLRKPGL